MAKRVQKWVTTKKKTKKELPMNCMREGEKDCCVGDSTTSDNLWVIILSTNSWQSTNVMVETANREAKVACNSATKFIRQYICSRSLKKDHSRMRIPLDIENVWINISLAYCGHTREVRRKLSYEWKRRSKGLLFFCYLREE